MEVTVAIAKLPSDPWDCTTLGHPQASLKAGLKTAIAEGCSAATQAVHLGRNGALLMQIAR